MVVERELVLNAPELQRIALTFDKAIAFPDLSDNYYSSVDSGRVAAELAFLAESGVVDRAGIVSIEPLDEALSVADVPSPGTVTARNQNDYELIIQGDAALEFYRNVRDWPSAGIRHWAATWSYRSAPIALHALATAFPRHEGPTSLYEVILREIPMPAENTPWEDVIAFRNEGTAIAQLRAMRQWISVRAAAGTSAQDASEELHHLLELYRIHMRGSGLRTRMSQLKTVLWVGGDLALLSADLPPFLTSADFAMEWIGTRLPQVPESAIAPGREVAYLASVNEGFGSRS